MCNKVSLNHEFTHDNPVINRDIYTLKTYMLTSLLYMCLLQHLVLYLSNVMNLTLLN